MAETTPPGEPEGDKPTGNGWLRDPLNYWWREPLAGIIAVGLGSFDVWKFGRDAGFTSSLDEILILTGVALIAGVKNLFGGTPPK